MSPITALHTHHHFLIMIFLFSQNFEFDIVPESFFQNNSTDFKSFENVLRSVLRKSLRFNRINRDVNTDIIILQRLDHTTPHQVEYDVYVTILNTKEIIVELYSLFLPNFYFLF